MASPLTPNTPWWRRDHVCSVGPCAACAHDVQAADAVTRKALLLDGGSAWAWNRVAWLDTYNGRAETAISTSISRANLLPWTAMPRLRRGWRAIAEHSPAAWAHRVLCPIYLLAGKDGSAAQCGRCAAPVSGFHGISMRYGSTVATERLGSYCPWFGEYRVGGLEACFPCFVAAAIPLRGRAAR